VRTGNADGLRRQDPDPPRPGRGGERCVGAERGRGRARAPRHRRVRRGTCRGQALGS
jgi:hypothetical protein